MDELKKDKVKAGSEETVKKRFFSSDFLPGKVP